MKLTFLDRRHLGWTIFGFVAFVLVSAAGMTYVSFRRLAASIDVSNETHENLFRTERALSTLEQAVSVKRAFLLTGERTYDVTSRKLARQVEAQLTELKATLNDDPGDVRPAARLNALIDVISERMAPSSGGIQSREEVAAVIAEDRRAMNEVRTLISRIEGIDSARQKAQQLTVEKHAVLALRAAGAGGAMAVVLIGFTMFVLRLQLKERTSSQRALGKANAQLEEQMSELKTRARESVLLNDLGEILQVSPTIAETSKVLPQFMSQLFPGVSGAIYSLKESRNQLDIIGSWGDIVMTQTFAPSECWALRKGRAHLVGEGPVLICDHVAGLPGTSSICVPMMRQGDAIGIVHLRRTEVPIDVKFASFAKMVSDQISLSLANLRLQESLRTRAIRDPLTGLFNRRYMEESLDREIRRAARKGTSTGVMMLDVDHFKQFNDTFGHAGGDALLQHLATLMTSLFREEDIVCRYGGEEFTVIISETDEVNLQRRAEELREAVKTLHVRLNGQPLGRVSVSAGIALASTHGGTVETLLAAADHALYQAKHKGRDRVVSASERTGQKDHRAA